MTTAVTAVSKYPHKGQLMFVNHTKCYRILISFNFSVFSFKNWVFSDSWHEWCSFSWILTHFSIKWFYCFDFHFILCKMVVWLWMWILYCIAKCFCNESISMFNSIAILLTKGEKTGVSLISPHTHICTLQFTRIDWTTISWGAH